MKRMQVDGSGAFNSGGSESRMRLRDGEQNTCVARGYDINIAG